jgi:protein-S-isoprenylcysteine O-methyltransferase Ste14
MVRMARGLCIVGSAEIDVQPMRGLFWRALLAFLALPATVAFLVPWLLAPSGAHFAPSSIPILLAGTVMLLWCVRDFYVAGQGTLAPWAPPKHLVTNGLYRFSRNPMYLAVLAILGGWIVAFRSVRLCVYTGLVACLFQLRVIFHEEPLLRRAHGAAWRAYRSEVRRWFGWRHRDGADLP